MVLDPEFISHNEVGIGISLANRSDGLIRATANLHAISSHALS